MVTPKQLAQTEYKYGFVTDIEEETAPGQEEIRGIRKKQERFHA